MENKKLIYYGGGALIVGAVVFFVWSFFQKPEIPLGETSIRLGGGADKQEPKPAPRPATRPTQPTTTEPKKGFDFGQMPDFGEIKYTPTDTNKLFDDFMKGN
jgi:hypothetical protein